MTTEKVVLGLEALTLSVQYCQTIVGEIEQSNRNYDTAGTLLLIAKLAKEVERAKAIAENVAELTKNTNDQLDALTRFIRERIG